MLVVLGGRALAYAATPTPLAGELGGPRLPVIAVVALAIAALLSLGVLWLAALGVRERHALELAPSPAPRLALARFGLDSGLLSGGSLTAFAALETWIHGVPACTCRGGGASTAPCTATRCRSCSPSRSRPRRCSRRLRHALAWARRVVRVLRRRLQPRAAARLQSLAPRRAHRAAAWLPRTRAVRARVRPLSPSRSHATRGETMPRAQVCRSLARAGVLAATLALAPSAFAHAELFPRSVPSGDGQLLQLAVPNEKDSASTTEIQITIPSGFDLENVAAVARLDRHDRGPEEAERRARGRRLDHLEGQAER